MEDNTEVAKLNVVQKTLGRVNANEVHGKSPGTLLFVHYHLWSLNGEPHVDFTAKYKAEGWNTLEGKIVHPLMYQSVEIDMKEINKITIPGA